MVERKKVLRLLLSCFLCFPTPQGNDMDIFPLDPSDGLGKALRSACAFGLNTSLRRASSRCSDPTVHPRCTCFATQL